MRKVAEMEYTQGLSREALERVRHRRLVATAKLILDLEPHRETKNWRDCVPAFQAYGLALFRAEAEEIVNAALHRASDERTVARQLDELQERVTDHILGKEWFESKEFFEASGTVQ